MMPNTVPNRPMNGPAEATVASTSRFDSSRSTSRAIETSRTLSMRACRPRKEPAACWNERFHSRMAATNSAAAPLFGLARQRGVELLQRLAGPEHLLEILHLVAEFAEKASLVEDDRPAPQGGEKEAEHHRLDDDVGRPEHRQDARVRSRGCGGYVGWNSWA